MAVRMLSTEERVKATIADRIAQGAPAAGNRVASMQVERVRTDAVVLWPDNPRKNDAAVPRLKELLAMYGQRTPIVVWKKNNTCYKGNTTLKAIRELGWPSVDVIFTDFPGETAAIAYAIADNKSSEFAEWDDDVLKRLMSASQIDPKHFGFTPKEMKGLMIREEKPDNLPISDVLGDRADLGAFIVVQFSDQAQCDEFKQRIGMRAQERAIMYDKFVEAI